MLDDSRQDLYIGYPGQVVRLALGGSSAGTVLWSDPVACQSLAVNGYGLVVKAYK